MFLIAKCNYENGTMLKKSNSDKVTVPFLDVYNCVCFVFKYIIMHIYCLQYIGFFFT